MAKPELPAFDKILVGRRIVTLRAAMSWDGVTMAREIGTTPQKLTNYEKGRNYLPVPEAVRLCLKTGATFDYIYRGDHSGLSKDLFDRIIGASRASGSKKRA